MSAAAPGARPLALQLLPFAAVIFGGYLAVGLPLAVLPLQIHDTLGYGAVTVGVLVGLQPVSTLLTRQLAGRLCEDRGSKPAAVLGLLVASAAGLFYLASTAFTGATSLLLLAAGRVVLGLGDSLFITGTAAWSIAQLGPAHAGRAMAWQGMAMYGAMALGSALGGAVWDAAGFRTVCLGVVAMPVLGALLAASMAAVAPAAGRGGSFLGVLSQIWAQGLGIALASSGYGTLAAFLALHFRAQGWPGPALALSAFGAAYITMRLLFGGLPDRIGGYRVAIASLAIEAAGLVTIWLAGSPALAFAGAALTGLGYSLMFPSLGVEAMRRVGPQDRSMMLAVYLACFDLGLGVAGPVAGVVVSAFDLPAAFLAAAGAALAGLCVVTAAQRGWLDRRPGPA